MFDPAIQGQGHAPTTTRSTSPTRRSYLMKTKPDLGITNPYALDDTQFAAAVDLLKKQKPAIGQYWGDYAKQEIDGFANGDLDDRDDLADHHQPAPGRDAAGQGRRDQAHRRGHRLVRHVDDQLEDEAPRLRVRLHRLPRVAGDQRQDRRVVRRGAGQLEVVRADEPTRTTARSSTRTTTRSGRTSGTGRRRPPIASTAART